MEEDKAGILTDRLEADGKDDALLPGAGGPGETELILNYSTSAAGSIRCEILEETGAPMPGYTLDDCEEIFGDHIERAVGWRGSTELHHLEGTPVRLRFVMQDADLYSIRFR
jgi:hypothetical protein